jgi:hypothetical protein
MSIRSELHSLKWGHIRHITLPLLANARQCGESGYCTPAAEDFRRPHSGLVSDEILDKNPSSIDAHRIRAPNIVWWSLGYKEFVWVGELLGQYY